VKANVLYRISDGRLLEAVFGAIRQPAPGEALLVLDEIPDFRKYRIVAGKVVERDKAELDAERAEAERCRAEVEAARVRLAGDLAGVGPKRSVEEMVTDIIRLLVG
jgi:hypothetical protein